MEIRTNLKNGISLTKFTAIVICLQCLYSGISVTSSTSTSSDIFYFELRENSLPNTYVGKISVKNGFTYRFNGEPPEFQLDAKTGVILTTTVPTDRETKSSYNLVILSSSPTYPLEVKIKILDINDNTPHWPSYINTNLSFSESAPIGTNVIVDTAIDPDEGHLQYQINVNSDNLFNTTSSLPFRLSYNISSAFLHLEVTDKLDRETQSSYVLNISAIDENYRSSSVLFYVKILDTNDNPPIFDHSDYSVSLNESVGKDVSILQVRATDSDEDDNDNSRISYYLLSNDYFNIDQNTGVISTAQEGPINCGTVTEETDTAYWKICVFTVFAHDFGTPRQNGRTYVTAKIQDSNDHSPVIKFKYFSRSDHASVDENAANGSVVAAVSVVDLDHGLNGMTSIEIIDGDKYGHFRLDSIGNSHIVRVNGSLDREKMSSYNLTIRAYDQGSPMRSSSAFLIVMVYDHRSQFSNTTFNLTISENEPTDRIVFNGEAKDNDSDHFNNEIIYEFNVTKVVWNEKAFDYLKNIYGKQKYYLFNEENPLQNIVDNIEDLQYTRNPFSINSKNGSIYLRNSLDYELILLYTIEIKATDMGWFSKTSTLEFDVVVTDVNDTIEKLASESSEPDLVTSSVNPDPMSIGVIVVITFFLILILVISTSFLIFHNQKKNQLRECNTNQRKITATIKSYITTTPSPPSTLMPPHQSAIGAQGNPVDNIPLRMPCKQPDVVSPFKPPADRPRPVPHAVPASMSHSHCPDNYTDNYNNIMATAEHYDLENASSIAPSDIDIVYHYKGYRNRDTQPLHHRHAPLARLSPSVSELSSMPRILTLQDLSPQVPPYPPLNNRTPKSKPIDNSNEEEDKEEEEDEGDNHSDDSFTCSEFDQNY